MKTINEPARVEAEREIVITRRFQAPRALVFKAWTEPERLARWFSPKGFTSPFTSVDLRPGGEFRFSMQSPDGRQFWGKGVYREIVEPERIVYVDSFTDEKGALVEPSHYGMSAGHPAESLVTVTFTESEGETTVTLRHEVPPAFPEREGMVQGWSEMLERLGGEVG